MKFKKTVTSILAFIMVFNLFGGVLPVSAASVIKPWMRISRDVASAAVGEEIDIISFALPYSITDRTLTWTSSDPAVADIVKEIPVGDGVVPAGDERVSAELAMGEMATVKGISNGTATITAKSNANGLEISCEIEVYTPQDCKTFYYVSPVGDDTNPGTEASPFATIEKARDTIRALTSLPEGGVTVYLRGGEYPVEDTIVFTPEDSGESDKPIIYVSSEGETAVITGGTELTGWNKLDEGDANFELFPLAAQGKIYVTDVETGWRFHDLYVNDERQQVARQFNTSEWSTWKTARLGHTSPNGCSFSCGGDLAGLEGNKDIELNFMPTVYWNTLAVVKDINAEGTSAQIHSKNPLIFNEGGTCNYNIMNAPTYLDVPGEWCVDSTNGKVYYWPYDNTMEGKKVVVPKPYEMIRFQGDGENELWEKQVSNITLKNLVIEYTDRIPDDQWPDEWLKRNAENPDAAVFMQGVDNCVIEHCTIRHTGAYAVALDKWAQNNKILSNELGDLGCGGVQIYGYGAGTTDKNKSNEVMYNNIHDTGMAPFLHSPATSIFGSSFNAVQYNLVRNLPYAAFYVAGTDHNSMNASTPNTRASFDTYGDKTAQYHIRFDELVDENGNPIVFPNGQSDPLALYREFQLSDYNAINHNVVDEFMLYMNDGGGLYSWYPGKFTEYCYNTLYKSDYGLHMLWPVHMDDYTSYSLVIGNRVQSQQQAPMFNQTYHIEYTDNLYAWPGKPDGYDELRQGNLDPLLVKQTPGLALGKPILNQPTALTLPITLSWQTTAGATRYILEVSENEDFANIVYQNHLTRGYDIVKALQEYTAYYFRVTAIGVLGDREVSDKGQFETSYTQKIEPPKNLRISSSFDNITVSWDRADHSETYEIVRVEDGDVTPISSGVKYQAYSDMTVEMGKCYSYRVRRELDGKYSDWAETDSVIARGMEVLFEDDFSTVKTEWSYKNSNASNINNGVLNVATGYPDYYISTPESNDWKDYIVEFDMTPNDWITAPSGDRPYQGIGFYTRYKTSGGDKDAYNFNFRRLNKIDLKWKINNKTNWSAIFDEAYDVSDIFITGQTKRVRLEHLGNDFKAYVDNTLIRMATDGTNHGADLQSGGVGIAGMYFNGTIDNFIVYKQVTFPTFVTTFVIDNAKRTVETQVGGNLVMPLNPIKRGYKFIGWFNSETDGAEVTEYTAEQTVYARFEPKATVEIGGVSISDKIYDGNPAALSGMVTATESYDVNKLEYRYYSIDAGTYDSQTPPTDAGSYMLEVSVPLDDDDYAGVFTQQFKIEKRPVTVTITVDDRAYDGTDIVAVSEFAVDGIIEKDADNIQVNIPETGRMTDAEPGENKPVSFAGISLNGSAKNNYKLAAQPTATVNISHVVGSVDKTALNALIAEAEEKVQIDYTVESWTEFSLALSRAKLVSANDDATQDDVDAAAEALKKAMDALEKFIEVTSVKIDGAAIQQVRMRNTKQFSATVNPTNATEQLVTWESSNEKIFTVKDGLVTGLSTGSAKLIVTCGGKTSFIMVQITA